MVFEMRVKWQLIILTKYRENQEQSKKFTEFIKFFFLFNVLVPVPNGQVG